MKASVFIATSLDGFIARANDALDWLPADGGEPHGYEEFIATVDAIVMGRRTFETVLTFDAWPFGARQVVVLSSRPSVLRAPGGAVCDFMSGTPREVVTRLESGELSLEQSLAVYEEGVGLARRGQQLLATAEKRVEILMSASGSVEVAPFDDRDQSTG